MKRKSAEDLIHALWSGDTHAIERALAASPDLDHRDHEGRTLLMEMTIEKRAPLVKVLLAHGANPAIADNEGLTPLHVAARSHEPEIVQLLLDAKAPVDAKDHIGNTPLLLALTTWRGQHDGDAIWELLLAGADRTIKNIHDVSPEDLAKEPSNYDPGQFFR